GKRDRMAAFYRTIGADQGVVHACLHAGQIASMPPTAIGVNKVANQQDLIFGVLGLSFTVKQIDELVQASGATEEDCKLFYGGRDSTLLNMPARTGYGPEIFDQAHKFCYEKRRQANRDMNAAAAGVGVAHKAVSHLKRETPDLRQIDAAKAKEMHDALDALELERDRLSEQKGRTENVPQQIEGVRAALATIDAEIEARLRWEAERAEIAGGPKQDFAKQLKLLSEKVEDTARGQQAALQRTAEIDEIRNAFSEGKPTCPISELPCPMTDAAKRKLIGKLDDEWETLHKHSLDAASLGQFNADKELLARYLEVRDSEPDGDDLEALRAMKEAREDELKELVALKPDVGDSADLEALKERISRGHGKIRLVDRYLRACDNVNELIEKQEALQEKSEAWERLVAALSSSGAKRKAVDKPLQDLRERISARLKEYAPGYDLLIDTREAFKLLVQTPSTGDYWIEIGELSTSECLRIGIVLQDALCHLTGFGLLLIDNFDMLETDNRKAIGEVLRQWSDEYETIIILTTKDEKPAPSPARTTYWVENGHVEVIQ
ncbi:hypothetical protein KAW64_16680, partial [bacterium]|nr:hypothetical protein [bacterium]